MDMNFLKELCLAIGISGNETEVKELIKKEVAPYADEITETPLGDLIVFKKGEKAAPKKIMIDAHMDEVGLIINHISEDGYLRFATVGGIDSNVLLGKTVYVNGKTRGVIGGKPVHLMSPSEKEKAVPTHELTVDIGASTREEAEAVCSVGDLINFEPFFELSRGTVKAKALDDRMGCAILVELIKGGMEYDTYFSFSTREEVGSIGAKTAAFTVAPELTIAVEGTVAGDVMGTSSPKACTKMGKGPAVSISDRGTVYDKTFFKKAFELAEELDIPCQARTNNAGSNDAGMIHRTRRGARAAAVSVPCRYIHSPVSMASVSDAENAVKLIRALAKAMVESK